MLEQTIYPISIITREFPKIAFELSVFDKKGSKEGFFVEYDLNRITIRADSNKALEYALYQLFIRLKGRSCRDIIGRQEPIFDHRALIIEADTWYRLPLGILVALPKSIVDPGNGINTLENILHIVLEMGWNKLFFVTKIPPKEVHALSFGTFRDIATFIQAKRMENGFMLLSDFENRDNDAFFHKITAIESYSDYLVWDQDTMRFENEGLNEFQRIQKEVQTIQQSSPLKLFYRLTAGDYVHAFEQSNWLLQLSKNCSNDTIIAFPSRVATDKVESYARHPLFLKKEHAHSLEPSRLFPLFTPNTAFLNENMLIDFSLNEWEHIVSRVHAEDFCGIGCSIDRVPERKTLGHAALWVLGQRLWKRREVYALLESWIACFRPGWSIYFEQGIGEHLHALFWKKEVLEACNCTPFSRDRFMVLFEEAITALSSLSSFIERIKEEFLGHEQEDTPFIVQILYKFQIWYATALHAIGKKGEVKDALLDALDSWLLPKEEA